MPCILTQNNLNSEYNRHYVSVSGFILCEQHSCKICSFLSMQVFNFLNHCARGSNGISYQPADKFACYVLHISLQRNMKDKNMSGVLAIMFSQIYSAQGRFYLFTANDTAWCSLQIVYFIFKQLMVFENSILKKNW